MEVLQRPLQNIPETSKPEVKSDPLQAFSLGIKRQNWASKEFSQKLFGETEQNHGVDLNYDYLDDEANKDYSPARMIKAKSSAEALQIRSDIDQEVEEMKVIQASGWGTAGEIFGGVFRPEALAAAVVTGGAGLLPTVAAEVAAEGLNEYGLHQQQLTRTKEESYINIGLVGAGTAILGAAARYLPETEVTDEAAHIATDEAVEALNPDRSAGAMQAGTTLAEEGMAGGKILETISIGQVSRLLQSESKTARIAIQKLVDSPFFTRANEQGKTQGVSAEALSEATVGRAVVTINEVKQIQKQAEMEPVEFYEQVGKAMSNGDYHHYAPIKEAAEKFRKDLVDPLLKESQELGLLPRARADVLAEIDEIKAKGQTPSDNLLRELDEAPENLTKYAESYFPRIYSSEKIYENWDQLKQILINHFKATAPDADIAELGSAAVNTMENMMGGVPVNTSVRGMFTPLKDADSRTLALTDNILEPYLEKNAASVLLKHAQGLAPYHAVKRVFGDDSIAEVTETIAEEYSILINKAKTAKEKSRLEKQRSVDLKALNVSWDRVLNQIERKDPSSTPEKAIRLAKVFNISTQLGQIVTSSIPDLARPLMQYGFRSYAKGMAKSLAQVFSSNAIPKAQINRMNVAVERTLNQRMLNITDEHNVGDNLANTGTKWWSKLTLFEQWTDALETVAAHSGMDWTLRQAGKIKNGQRLTRSEKGRLARMGFGEDDLIAFYNASGQGVKDPILKFADSLKWNDVQLAKRFEAGIGGDVRRVIIRIGNGEKPAAMDDGFFSLMFQYQSFAISATNKMLIAGIQQRDLNLASGMLASIALGSLVGAGKSYLRGKDPDQWDEQTWLYEGIDRSGLLGVYRPALSALQAATGNIPSRYLHRGAENIFGGPTGSQMANLVKLGSAAAEGDDEEALERAARLTPFVSNTLHVRQVLKKLGEE